MSGKIARPRPEDVRVRTEQSVMIVTNIRNGESATAWLAGGFWHLEHGMVKTRYRACGCTLPPCPWPDHECLVRADSGEHMNRRCHHWHAPKAMVAAAVLTMGTIDATPRPLTLAERREELMRRLKGRDGSEGS